MASFNGIDLGPYVIMRTVSQPKARQINEYPAINGLESLDLGARGRVTEAEGACIGMDLPTLVAVEQQFYDLQDLGATGNLIDTIGRTWQEVILVTFQPLDRITPIPGGFGRRYKMEFLHLS